MQGHIYRQLALRRRELIRPQLPEKYKPLYEGKIPYAEHLFPEDLTSHVDTMDKVAKLTAKFETPKPKGKGKKSGGKQWETKGTKQGQVQSHYQSKKKRPWNKKKGKKPAAKSMSKVTSSVPSHTQVAGSGCIPIFTFPQCTIPQVSQEQFNAGRLQNYLPYWSTLTSYKEILNTIRNYRLEFTDNVHPIQEKIPRPIIMSQPETDCLDKTLHKLESLGFWNRLSIPMIYSLLQYLQCLKQMALSGRYLIANL